MKRPSFVWLSPTLTAIGKKLGIDAHYFAKNSALVLVGHGVGILRGVITGYLVARLFQKEIYGEYQFMLSMVGMVSFFGLVGIGNPVARAWARGDSFSLSRVTMHQLKACLIGSALLLAAIPFLGIYNREELWLDFLVAAIIFPLPPIAMMRFGSFTVGKSRFDISLKATLVWSVLMILATLFVILFHQSAVLMLITSMCIPPLVYLFFSRNFRPPQGTGPDQTMSIVRYAWQFSVATVPIELVWYIDKLLIAHFFGLSQLATFAVAMLIPEQIKLVMKQFLPVAFSKQAKGEDSMERRMKILKAGTAGMGVLAIGIGLYIALTPWLMPFLFPQYEARTVVILTSIAAVTLLNVPGTLFVQYMEAQGMIRQVRLSNWIAAGIFGISLFVLIPWLGLLGAALARGIFRFTYMGTSIWFAFFTPLQKKT